MAPHELRHTENAPVLNDLFMNRSTLQERIKINPTNFGGIGFNKFNGANFQGVEVFQAMQTAFGCATSRFPQRVYETYHLFGGNLVRIRIVGRQLAHHILQPFSHLRTTPPGHNAPELTIDLWDENDTNISCYTGPKVSNSKWRDVTSMSSDGQFVGQLQPHTMSCFDRGAQHIVGSINWSDQIFIYERAKPLSRLLLEWYNDRHIQVVHAALVSKNGHGVLFIGKSGMGKSTASLACLCNGFQYLGEDFIGLQKMGDGTFVGHSLYNSVFLETGHLARFPEMAPHVIKAKPHEKKSVAILSHIFPRRLKRSVQIRAVVLPQVIDAPKSRVRQASKGQALLILGPSSLIEIPSRGMNGFANLAQLIDQVPSYWLDIGRDLDSIHIQVEKLIEEMAPQ